MSSRVRFDEFEFDRETGELRRSGEPIALNPQEAALLELLVDRGGEPVDLERIEEALAAGDEPPAPGTVTSHVSRLRRKLSDHGKRRLITNLRGRGYALAPLSRSGERPFVGRGETLRQVRRFADRALRKDPTLVLIRGARGTGRTTLLERLQDELEDEGMLVVLTGCRLVPRSELAPWAALVGKLLTALGEDRPESLASCDPSARGRIASAFPELAPHLGPVPAYEASGSVVAAIEDLLRGLSQHRPLALLFDDLPLADRPSLDLLHVLAQADWRGKLLVVGTMDRSPQQGEGVLQDLLASGLQSIRYLDVTRFGPAELRETLEAWGVEPRAAADVVEPLLELTNGVPQLVGSILSELAPGDITPDHVRRLATSRPIADALVSRQLSRLPAASRELLSVATVFGHEFSAALLAETMSRLKGERIGVAEVEEALQPAVDSEFVEVARDARRYRFTATLVHGVLYEALPAGERREAHHQLARALCEASAPPSEFMEHFLRGDLAADPEARVVALDSARDALFRNLNDDALRWLTALDEIQPLGDESDRKIALEVRLHLGRALTRAGQASKARETFARACDLARNLEAPIEFATAAIGMGGSSPAAMVDDPDLHARLSEATEWLERRVEADEGDAREAERMLAFAEARLACTSPIWGEVALRRDACNRAIDRAERTGSRWARAYASYVAATVLPIEAHAERERIGRDLLAFDPHTEQPPLGIHCVPRWVGHRFLLESAMVVGDRMLAEEARHGLRLVARKEREPMLSLEYEHMRFGVFHLAGLRDRALAAIEESKRLALAANEQFTLHATIHHFLLARDFRADLLPAILAPNAQPSDIAEQARKVATLEEAEAALTPAGLVALVDHSAPWAAGITRICLATSLSLRGESQESQHWLTRLRRHTRDFSEIPKEASWLTVTSLTADLAAELGDAESAGRLLPLLEPLAELHVFWPGVFVSVGPVAYYVARLHRAVGNLEQARSHIERAALKNDQAFASPTCEARILLERARLAASSEQRAALRGAARRLIDRHELETLAREAS